MKANVARVKSRSKMVRASQLHAPMGSDTLGCLEGRKGLQWYFPAVGRVRFLASQEVIGLSGQLSCNYDLGNSL